VITAAQARKTLFYNKRTGILKWLVRPSNRVHIGDEAGTISHGYVAIEINRKIYRAHRLAWLIVTGRWPTELDHKNGKRDDNRWSNLREVTRLQNCWNSAAKKSSSGVKGVHWSDACGCWKAAIKANGRQIHLGIFKKKKDAQAAYIRAAKKHFGEFARAA
jgi:hypothetical protein